MVKNMLTRKLKRDMLRAKWQFLSIAALCALGVMVFSGLDASWRDIDLSINRYFDAQRLTDFWVNVPVADSETVNAIRGLSGVEHAQSRLSAEVKAVLPGEPALALHAFEGEARINIPALQSGAALAGDDARGCLLEEQFALAQGLFAGDELTIRAGNREESFIIRGLVISPEYVITARDLLPEPASYGFMLANSAAFPQLAMNEILVLLRDGTDGAAVKREIEALIPHAIVRDRGAHKSTEMIRSEVEQFRSLSGVFPILFFAVSALIVLTTMTRMVDYQRTQLGVLKALGYRDGQILRHYLSYGFYPSLAGSALGLLAGKYALPGYMWALEESTLFRLPPKVVAPISPASLAVLCASVALSCLICYIACRKNADEVPASLLRPKAPKAGNRVLLERFPRLWNRFAFNAKMILRNIFRSKTRTIMALLGVLCCTSLIITALGLQDTFANMVSTHYGQTLRYDLRADLKPNAERAYKRQIQAATVEGLMEMAVSVQGEGESRTVLLSVLEENQTLIDLGIDARSTALPDGGIIMTEKLAGVMGVQAGDAVTLKFPGELGFMRFEVAKLAPMGMGQGAYMYANLWESLQASAFTPTAWLISEPSADCIDYLNQLDAVDGIEWISVRRDETMTALNSLTGITVLMAAFALTLAFVVLYNMGILNFVERTREFATLKVLGYHRKEIRSLIVRENALISCVGAVLGILPGLWLTALVMRASEPEDMAFAPFVSVATVCAACGLTLAFSLFIQRALTRKVRSIDMVEALKSVE